MLTQQQKQDVAATQARLRARSWAQRIRDFFVRLERLFKGAVLEQKLQDPHSKERSEAQRAVDRVVYATKFPPDCVVACVINGGCAIKLTHQGAGEWFVHETYQKAADEAIRWAQAHNLSTGTVSVFNRAERRAIEAQKRVKRKQH